MALPKEIKGIKQIRPEHYGGKDNPYEVIKVIDAWGLQASFNIANAVKYLSRMFLGKKSNMGMLQDLHKAKTYIEFEIERIEKNG